MLTKAGYRVSVAHDRASAVWAARRRAMDWAIVDQKLTRGLGDRSGIDLARELALEHPAIRIVIYTGYPCSKTAFRAGQTAGVVGYLQKPARREEIVAVLGGGEATDVDVEPMSLARMETEYAERVVADCDGNMSVAADIFGIDRATLARKLSRR
jgi:two-component system response regulator RegA